MKAVTIYTTPACGFCVMAKRFFKEHGVTYTEKDVSQNSAAAQEMIDRSGQMGVPVTIVSEGDTEELIVGFDRARLASVIGVQE